MNIFKICGFQTPNFALDCDDVPREGTQKVSELPYRITMQYPRFFSITCMVPRHITFGKATRIASTNACRHTMRLISRYYYPRDCRTQAAKRTTHVVGVHRTTEKEARGGIILQGKFDMLDEMYFGLLHAYRITPEEVAAKHQKQREEEESREREASRKKVLEWMGNVSGTSP